MNVPPELLFAGNLFLFLQPTFFLRSRGAGRNPRLALPRPPHECLLQPFESNFAVAHLRTTLRRVNHDTGRKMADTNGGVGGIPVLPAGPAPAVKLDPDVAVVDFHNDNLDAPFRHPG